VELTNTYRLNVSVAQAWAVLADLPRVAACLPGATPTDAGPAGAGPADGGLAGAGPADRVLWLTVDPGPYRVQARVAEVDEAAHRIVITAEGTPGLTAVRVAAALRPWGPGAELSMLTDLTLSGRLAGLGPGVVAAAASQLLGQVAANLERAAADIAPAPAPPAPAPAAAAPTVSAAATTAPPARRHEPAYRQLVPGVVAAGAAGAAAGLVLVARRLAAARK
jgi:uncharacterized protein